MSNTGQLLAELILQYINSSTTNANYRLIVPGLTASLAEEIHNALLEAGKTSFLVINEQRDPSEVQRWISPVNLTTMRIGSFVAVTDIGALSEIRDSIQGTGGVIRSRAFSEEWPWIDEGPDWARFRGPFLDKLLSGWTDDDTIKKWLSNIIVDEILPATAGVHNRQLVLLEDILGKFNPSLYPTIKGTANQFLYHCGIPMSDTQLQNPKTIAQKQRKLLTHIGKRIATESDLREQVLDNVDTNDPQATDLTHALSTFIDGLHLPDTFPKTLLAFNRCWGLGSQAIENWKLLTSERLSELFDIPDSQKVSLQAIFLDQLGGISSSTKTEAACRLYNPPQIEIKFQIAPSAFSSDSTRLKLSNKTRVLYDEQLTSHISDAGITISIKNELSKVIYKEKIPLRVEIFIQGFSVAKQYLYLHCCGENRPAFVISQPDFIVDDAKQLQTDGTAVAQVHSVEGPIQLYFFSHVNSEPTVQTNDTDSFLPLSTKDGYWYSQTPIDVLEQPTGSYLCRCQIDTDFIDLTFESTGADSGAFTLEDELRESIARADIARTKEILILHTEGVRETYSRLGTFNPETQRLTYLAKLFEQPQGYKVILINLLTGRDSAVVECGPYARMGAGTRAIDQIAATNLPENARGILEKYGKARELVRSCVISDTGLDRKASKHPDYALLPLYIEGAIDTQSQVEAALTKYLTAYSELQNFLLDKKRHLNWEQLFVLSHLDTVVHWSQGQDSTASFLIGPWHPLVLAKRMMVQRALVLRGKRLLRQKLKTSYKLVGLLANISGFYWHSCVRRDETNFEVAYVTPTSDPGWHCAIKQQLGETPDSLSTLFKALQDNYALEAIINLPPSSGMIATTIRSYLKTFPSKRHLGIFFPAEFSGMQEIETVDKILHARDDDEQEKPTTEGLQLVGGINLSFQSKPKVPVDTVWSNPPLKVFHYEEFNTCLVAQHPDIQFNLPARDIRFAQVDRVRGLPRGANYGAVFSQALSRIDVGMDGIPLSVVEEWDKPPTGGTAFHDCFREACANACRFSQTPLGVKRRIALPANLDTAWSVIPGTALDPRVFVSYVTSGDNPRALWDYRINLLAGTSSYFVLSQIPQAFLSAVDTIFEHAENLAFQFVRELSQIGLAIAGEAMRSGRNALGTIGFVGAARLFAPITTRELAMPQSSTSIAFMLPVDSFQEFFSATNEGLSSIDEPDLRADLLLIKLRLPTNQNGNLGIEATAVECKYTTATYTDSDAANALKQASRTEEQFRHLCNQSLAEDGIPERLALLRLIRFGLRISHSDTGDLSDENDLEHVVYEKLLRSEFNYISPTIPFVLVTTEYNLVEEASWNLKNSGVWIRLNPRHWPGVAETSSIADIKHKIRQNFSSVEVSDNWPTQAGTSHPEASVALSPQTSNTSPENTPVSLTPTQYISATETPINPETNVVIVSGGQPETVVANLAVSNSQAATPDKPQGTEYSQGVSLARVRIGTDASHRAVYFDPHSPVARLDNANMMISGSSGKGKTQFLKYLISELRDQGANTFVFDFKNDFSTDQPFLTRAKLTPIEVSLHGIPFNPLIPFPILDSPTQQLFLQCGQHIEGISSVFRRTYGLGVQQVAAVRTAIREAFAEYEIDYGTKIPYSSTQEFPDFATVGRRLRESNLSAYNRLDPLFNLDLFRPANRGVSFDTMINSSVTINLSLIQSDELKNTLTELMVRSAHSYYNPKPHVGTMRQAIVVDEAHRILKADFVENFALQCRAYGVSLILSSQYPNHFPESISGCMATKIIHGHDRDKALVKQIVDLLDCTGQEQEIGGLAMFEAFFSNKHHPSAQIKTIAFPHSLVLTALRNQGPLTRQQLSSLEGLDERKLTVTTIIEHLKKLELCQETNGVVHLVTA